MHSGGLVRQIESFREFVPAMEYRAGLRMCVMNHGIDTTRYFGKLGATHHLSISDLVEPDWRNQSKRLFRQVAEQPFVEFLRNHRFRREG